MADGQQTQDPLAESAQAEAGQVDPALVAPNAGERILGMGVTPGGSLDRRLQQYHAAKLAQAKMYRGNLASSIAQIAKGTKWDATLNNGAGGERPLTQDELTDLNNQKDEATKQYNKIIGVDPESKGALDKAHSIIDFILGRKQQQQAQQQRPGGMSAPPTPQYGSTVGESGVSMTPPPGSTPTVMDNGVTMTPPPSRPQPSVLEQSVAAPMLRHQMALSQARSTGLQTQQAQFEQNIAQRTEEAKKLFDGDITSSAAQRYIATGTFPPFHGLQKSTLVDPNSGEPVIFDPMQGTYATQDGRQVDNPIPQQKPQMVEVVMPNGDHAIAYEQYKKLTDQQGNPLPAGTKKFYSQMADRETTTKTWKTVQQPDGSTALVPVVNESVMRRGGMATPPVAGAAPAGGQGAGKTGFPGGVTPSKPPNATKSSPPNNAAAAMGLPPGSKIVGGKVPPGVSKAYDAYNGSVTRFKVMQEALPKALKGDQQAMINLLYNHIGMTTGLQKGGRITQPIIDEAQNSAPWEATILKRIGVGNEFEMQPDLLRGVVIDPQTMHNMIGLAEDRVNNEYAAWQREIGSAKTGYGMTTPPPPTPPDIQSTGKTIGKPNTFKPF